MAEYTPGPWRVSGKSTINGPRGWVASVSMADRAANARLIAAAPELLEALKLWLSYDNLDEADFSEVGPMLLYAQAIEATRAAIAKATDGEG